MDNFCKLCENTKYLYIGAIPKDVYKTSLLYIDTEELKKAFTEKIVKVREDIIPGMFELVLGNSMIHLVPCLNCNFSGETLEPEISFLDPELGFTEIDPNFWIDDFKKIIHIAAETEMKDYIYVSKFFSNSQTEEEEASKVKQAELALIKAQHNFKAANGRYEKMIFINVEKQEFINENFEFIPRGNIPTQDYSSQIDTLGYVMNNTKPLSSISVQSRLYASDDDEEVVEGTPQLLVSSDDKTSEKILEPTQLKVSRVDNIFNMETQSLSNNSNKKRKIENICEDNNDFKTNEISEQNNPIKFRKIEFFAKHPFRNSLFKIYSFGTCMQYYGLMKLTNQPNAEDWFKLGCSVFDYND